MRTTTPATTNRKRVRSTLVGFVCFAATCQDAVLGFTSSPAHSTGLSHQRVSSSVTSSATAPFATARPSSSLHAATRVEFEPATSTLIPRVPRLTHPEQMALLDQTVELRRIRQVDAELAVTSASTSTLLSVRAQACGFGDDLESFETAIDQGHKARETLVTRNMGLVHFCLNEIIGSRRSMQSLSREDLVQEGAIGLARAVDRWNPEIGGKFSTYAVYWIRATVIRCIAERDDLMRVPEHVSTAARKVTRAAKKLGLEINGEHVVSAVTGTSSNGGWEEAAAAKALAEEAGVTPRQLTEAMRVKARRSGGILSYESWMQNGQDFSVDLTPVTDDEPDAMSSLKTEHLKDSLSRFLRPREMEALSWRYGLMSEAAQEAVARDYLSEAEELVFGQATPAKKEMVVKGKWGEAMSFVEVGKHMQVSAEYGRRLCHAALQKLRNAAEEGVLEPALLF